LRDNNQSSSIAWGIGWSIAAAAGILAQDLRLTGSGAIPAGGVLVLGGTLSIGVGAYLSAQWSTGGWDNQSANGCPKRLRGRRHRIERESPIPTPKQSNTKLRKNMKAIVGRACYQELGGRSFFDKCFFAIRLRELRALRVHMLLASVRRPDKSIENTKLTKNTKGILGSACYQELCDKSLLTRALRHPTS
jgi:hypothetical protein